MHYVVVHFTGMERKYWLYLLPDSALAQQSAHHCYEVIYISRDSSTTSFGAFCKLGSGMHGGMVNRCSKTCLHPRIHVLPKTKKKYVGTPAVLMYCERIQTYQAYT